MGWKSQSEDSQYPLHKTPIYAPFGGKQITSHSHMKGGKNSSNPSRSSKKKMNDTATKINETNNTNPYDEVIEFISDKSEHINTETLVPSTLKNVNEKASEYMPSTTSYNRKRWTTT